MKTHLAVLTVWLLCSGLSQAQGLLIPVERKTPPLAMVHHRVQATLEDQVAVTKVEQSFRNHTDRPLEATYVFPVPRGASVREFAMWVDGKRVKGELVEAAKARQIYTDIVRRIMDPGLLEYLGTDLLQMKVFPVPPRGDQKIEVSFTALLPRDHDVVEYTYPLRTDGKATSTLEDFTLRVALKSQHPISNIYSPTHAITLARPNDREAVVGFEKNQCVLDRSFQLLYTVGDKDVGLTTLLHRPNPNEDGYFLLLLSPRPELSSDHRAPRDLVFVLDTSGSMAENGRLLQAKKALTHCLRGLSEKDRFAVIQFATTVNRFSEGLIPVSREQVEETIKRIDKLEALGGTAIDDALQAALDLQPRDDGRTFTIAFFTDGKPTIGETAPERILEHVRKKNTAQTRFFVFGVGHDLNASLLDQLAEQTRGVATFVRPGEDLELTAKHFFERMSRPVLTNLHLTPGKQVQFLDVYPPQLPDLFHGGQIVVLGRYHGSGDVALKLTGRLGKETRELVYETPFHARVDNRPFVEDLWARRKVGYLLDQIRVNGEKKELVDAVVTLAKRYGIATPYTSYLVVPDAPIPIVRPTPIAMPMPRPFAEPPPILAPRTPGGTQRTVAELAKEVQQRADGLVRERGEFSEKRFASVTPEDKASGFSGALAGARDQQKAFETAHRFLKNGSFAKLQVDQLGVELSVQMTQLKNQTRLQQTALRQAAGRNLVELGGIWLDEGFVPTMPVVTVKAMSDAYFRILERQAQMKDVFQLGSHLVWVTPSGTALIIDTTAGQEEMADNAIDRLFKAK